MYKFVKKDSLMQVIYMSLPPKEAGLLSGMILGDKNGFDKNFLELLRKSGLIHLVIVSGSNVMLLTKGLIEGLAGFFNRKKAIIVGLIVGWGYTSLVGWEIPVLRAVLLISIYFWAQILGRKYSISRSLMLTVLIMFLADRTIFTQISFWLSLAAFVAIVLKPREVKNPIIDNLLTGLWVSIFITPILAYSFGEISLISFLSNSLVLGTVEVITAVGAVGTIIGLIRLTLGKFIIILIYPLLKYLAVLVESMGNLGFASLSINFNILLLVGWYLVIIGFLLKRKYES
jgi:competence protein ComEC